MNDKEIKILHYREENKAAKKGQIVFTGSSLMEMFPINKLLRNMATIQLYTIVE